jgi:hypothetical protein
MIYKEYNIEAISTLAKIPTDEKKFLRSTEVIEIHFYFSVYTFEITA